MRPSTLHRVDRTLELVRELIDKGNFHAAWWNAQRVTRMLEGWGDSRITPFRLMKIGELRYVPKEELNTVRTHAYRAGQKLRRKYSFTKSKVKKNFYVCRRIK